ncbi:hypothetical protein BDV36DRAFT_275909 [Aspergillus pseudocaelatus]|uniref:Uncharacterized protein n=1 Tax=Aspergillus pseudocaelatus TaxID=1825620 RepID=A0ABQ6W4K2_9EURO|nr:hypothetical protein BDV36DRAFT_275909 [Aspergillus pseudocaelatus]
MPVMNCLAAGMMRLRQPLPSVFTSPYIMANTICLTHSLCSVSYVFVISITRPPRP